MSQGDEDDPKKKIPRLPSDKKARLESPEDRADDASREAQQYNLGLSERDIEKEARENEHDRAERFKDAFEALANTAIKIAFVVAIIFGLTWAWHILAPVCLHWLDPAQIDHLQNLIAGGVVASLAGEHFRRRLG